ncbi:hypothetical protein SEEE2558_15421, partial [Salmonella enterica subsp. enterica serovar Enteritidis str. 22558]
MGEQGTLSYKGTRFVGFVSRTRITNEPSSGSNVI